ncbi:hypothetical protein [Azospirillum sp. ST 5-10]|uniref:hypothetical protein n=1 Tax=unclassified Azospirillum TaxID=2630922 RepID=UPI003F4A7FB7
MASVSDLKQFIPNLRCYSRALTGNWQRADDLVEVCLQSATKNFMAVPHNSVHTWLFSLLHDAIVREAASGELPRKASVLARDPPSDTHVADSREPGLQMAFRALGFAQKAVLFLMAIEDFSDQEAAIITRMTVLDVRQALREALDQLNALPLGFLALRGEEADE